MESLGYITLQEASKRSGKSVEALKKQCQSGRLRGAIKQGKTWFVPNSEVVVTPQQPEDASLHLLLTLTEGVTSGKGAGIFVTLYLKGVILTGKLISRDTYLSRFKQNVKSFFKFPGETEEKDKQLQEKMHESVDKYFQMIVHANEKAPIKFIHLDEVTLVSGNDFTPHNGELLRIRLDAVDGFALGKMERAKE